MNETGRAPRQRTAAHSTARRTARADGERRSSGVTTPRTWDEMLDGATVPRATTTEVEL